MDKLVKGTVQHVIQRVFFLKNAAGFGNLRQSID